jgi:hypothetical protein
MPVLVLGGASARPVAIICPLVARSRQILPPLAPGDGIFAGSEAIGNVHLMDGAFVVGMPLLVAARAHFEAPGRNDDHLRTDVSAIAEGFSYAVAGEGWRGRRLSCVACDAAANRTQKATHGVVLMQLPGWLTGLYLPTGPLSGPSSGSGTRRHPRRSRQGAAKRLPYSARHPGLLVRHPPELPFVP